MIRKFLPAIAFAFVIISAGCSSGDKKDEASTETASATNEPAKEAGKITVQHILIGFQGSLPGKSITRSQADAEQLANDLFARAQAGEDFPELVRQYTDDAFPGIYSMLNTGMAGDPSSGAIPREQMVAGFGDASFALEVGEIGMARFSRPASPYGWHIVKRID